MPPRTTCLLLAAILAFGRSAAAQRHSDAGPPPGCCLRGEYWRVTSFCAPICGGFDPTKLRFAVYHCQRGWVDSSLEEFLASDSPELSTCFFLPGFEPNVRNDRNDYVNNATRGGWLIYNRVAPRCRKFRVVLWAWPANRDAGARMAPNMRQKLCLCERYGWYLAWLIDQMHPRAPVGLISDSLGAGCLTGALHLLGGGAIAGETLPRIHPERLPPSVAMMASTMPNEWLAINGRHGQALAAVERMLITVNPNDRLLKLYVVAHIGGGGQSLGATGISGSLGFYGDRVRYLYVAPYLGGRHWWTAYLRSPPIVAAFRPYAFPPPGSPAQSGK